MIDAAEHAHLLVTDVGLDELNADRQRRDALLWNFTVLGEAGRGQLDQEPLVNTSGEHWRLTSANDRTISTRTLRRLIADLPASDVDAIGVEVVVDQLPQRPRFPDDHRAVAPGSRR